MQMASINLISYFFVLGVDIFIARLLGAEDYGDFAVAFSTISFFSIFVPIGLDKSIAKFLPPYFFKKAHSSIKGLILFSLLVIFFMSVLISFLFCFSYKIFSPLESEKHPVFYGICIILFFAYQKIALTILGGINKVKTSLNMKLILEPLLFFLMVLISSFLFKLTDYRMIVILGIESFLVVFIYTVLIKFFFPFIITLENLNFEFKEWFFNSIPMMLNIFLLSAYYKVDLWIIEIFGHLEHEVGVSAAIKQVNSITVSFSIMMMFILSFKVAELTSKNEIEQLKKYLKKTLKEAYLTAIIYLLAIIFFGKIILSSYGKEFSSAYVLLLISTVSYILNILFSFSCAVLQNSGYEKVVTIYLTISIIVYTIIEYLFVFKFGLKGAVSGFFIGQIILLGVFLILVRKKLKFWMFFFKN